MNKIIPVVAAVAITDSYTTLAVSLLATAASPNAKTAPSAAVSEGVATPKKMSPVTIKMSAASGNR
jgi:hypothetical protein